MYMYNDERLTVGGTSLRFREVLRCSENVIDSHVAQYTGEVSSEGQMVDGSVSRSDVVEDVSESENFEDTHHDESMHGMSDQL